jgi:ligand-binding SRPBCC domain-containing protein
MKRHRLQRRQEVARPIDEVFDFFRDPFNLEAITPPWLRFRILSASDRPIRLGTRIQYRLRIHGVPFAWESRITEYRPGVLFADEQVTGPYKWWYHRHQFTPTAEGVVIEDRVDYEMPFGPLGELVHRLAVRGQLTRIFEHRAWSIAERFSHPPRLGEEQFQ